MTRLFIAGFDTESNSFSPIPTGRAEFEEGLLAFGDATRRPLITCSLQLAHWRQAAETLGWEVVESVCAVAEPSAPMTSDFYVFVRDRILADLTAARPDVVLLALHGAMLAIGCDDTEGDILARIREIVGPDVVVGAELDLHCHLTPQMVTAADLLVAYLEYPHTDVAQRADALFELARLTFEDRVRPTAAVFDCRMVGSFPTQAGPMRTFVDELKALERDDPRILSVSVAHGFPPGDVADNGARVMVVTDDDPSLAQAEAERLGRRLYAVRHRIVPPYMTIPQAIDVLAAVEGVGPVIVADTGDNPGGGSSGDGTFLLRAILERGLTGIALGLFWDPVVVRFCTAAGVGATLDLRLGGKCGPLSGEPVDLAGARVRAIKPDMLQRFGGAMIPMGTGVWIEAEGLDIVVNDLRTQVFDAACMVDLGIDVRQRRGVVVKSINHFADGFRGIGSATIYVKSPGSTSAHYEDIPFRKRSLSFWPRVDDPLSVENSR